MKFWRIHIENLYANEVHYNNLEMENMYHVSIEL